MTNTITSPQKVRSDQPITKTKKTNNTAVILGSNSQIFLQLFETMILQNNYATTLSIIEKLPKNIVENSPEIMMFQAIALKFIGNRDGAAKFSQKFMDWLNNNQDLAWAQVLYILFLHRTMQNRPAGELGRQLLERSDFLTSLSPLEQKLFYNILALSTYFTMDININKLQQSAQDAKKYLELSTQIKDDNRLGQIIDYLSLCNLADIAIGEESNGLEPLQAALDKAKEGNIDPMRACIAWQTLIKDKATNEPLPDICPKDTPVAPEVEIEIIR